MTNIKHTVNNWLLVDSGPGTAVSNMNVDEDLLAQAPDLPVAGTLRFYWFDPPAVTLGHFQNPTAVNQANCVRDGIPIVRRLTGGRAVFHHHELTYSLVLPVINPYFGAGVTASFKGIASALQQGLLNLGIETELEKSRSIKSNMPDSDCFRSAGRYEIKVRGHKLLGSAQVRKKGYLLQHGSVYLRYFPKQAKKYLDPREEPLSESAVADLSRLLDRPVSRSEVKDALINGFRRNWGINFIHSISSHLNGYNMSLAMNKTIQNFSDIAI